MSRKIRHLIHNQAQVKVASQTHDSALFQGRLVTLALFFAGVFYFYAYFWGSWGAALTGG